MVRKNVEVVIVKIVRVASKKVGAVVFGVLHNLNNVVFHKERNLNAMHQTIC